MKEINNHLVEIDKKLPHLKVQLDLDDRRSAALELVVSWLLARQPDDQAMRFLSAQANELENAPDKTRHSETVALLIATRRGSSGAPWGCWRTGRR